MLFVRREFKDLGDIVEMLRSNSSKIKDEDLEVMCDNYGPDRIYERIKEVL